MAKKKRSWLKWIIILILIGGGIAAWRYLPRSDKDKAPQFKTTTVSRGDIIQAVTATGQITPVKSVVVGSQVSGIIDKVLVDFNSHVTNGQVIAQIDPSTFQQNITQAEAELENAKAALELADVNLRRAKELKANALISAAEYDQTEIAQHQAQAVVKMREAALRKSKVDLERATIYSPVDGVVISRNVDVGQTVAASFNTPTLFQIANDLTKMQIEAMVSEADVGGVESNQVVNFTVDAFPNRQFHGKVEQVRYAPVTNQNVVNYITVVSVKNPDLKLRPGMTASASIVTAERDDVLKIPNGALRFRPGENVAVTGETNRVSRGATATNSSGNRGENSGGRSEEMRQRFQNMSPEEREQMRARFAARGGSGGGGRSASGEGPGTHTVYLLEKEAKSSDEKPVLKAVTIKTGITDGTSTEVISGLKEGDVVVTGLNPTQTGENSAGSPFGSPFGGMRRR